MRVHLNRLVAARSRDDGERGAVAVLVAVSSVLIFVLAAFSVDFGMAYVSKRDLQKGADSAALAAASEIIKRTNPTQNCAAIASRFVSDAAFRNAVIAKADAYATTNDFLNSQRQDIQVRCSADNKRVEVFYAHQGSTPGLFDAVIGGGDLVASRDATADVFVRDQGTGLRPYFICDGDLNARLKATLATGGYVAIRYPSLDANCSFYNGNWYTSDCPDDGNNGTLDENTRNGCLSSVGVVIDQTTAPPPTQAQINAAVVSACTDATSANPSADPARCLVANPGNVAANTVVQAWNYLLTLPGIALPTFRQTWNDYATAQITRCRTGGNNGCYPIEAIAAVKVCAYKWGNNKTGKASDTTACPGINSLVFPNDNDNYLYLRLVNLQYSGSSSPGGCPVGGNCDLGGRGTRLID